MNTQVVELIVTQRHEAGATEGGNGVFRLVEQLWTMDGKLVAEFDPAGKYTPDPQGDETFIPLTRADHSTSWWSGEVE